MARALFGALAAILAFAQEPRAILRIEVKAESAAVAGAAVTVNGETIQTGRDGVAIASVAPGQVEIKVAKEGFLAGAASLLASEAREWHIAVELQPLKPVEEEITVSATRTDRRLQDVPTRVEVLGPEEIEEKMLMTP